MNWKTFPYGVLCFVAFFVIGNVFHGWRWAWLVFLTTPIFNWVVENIDNKKKSKKEETESKEDDWKQF